MHLVIHNETTYETIRRMKSGNEWDFCLATFPKAWTLDFYYRVYELVLQYYPSKPYGYATQLVSNSQIISKLGGVFAGIETARRARTQHRSQSRTHHGTDMATLISIIKGAGLFLLWIASFVFYNWLKDFRRRR